MKKTFRIYGNGSIDYTTDTVRNIIAKQKEMLEGYKWDLENWFDVPEWRTRENIRATEKAIKMYENCLAWAIANGYDKEI